MALATSAQTARASPSASCSSTPPAPECRRNTCCPCISTRAPTTSSTCTILCTWACAKRVRRPRTFIRLSTSSSRRCRRCFRSAASTLRIGRVRTPYTCSSATATSIASITTTCKAPPASLLAGMINATKLKGTKLKDEKYLFLGAGSAGIGLANLLCSALVAQGMTLKEAQSRVYMFDINGLLEDTRKDLVDFQTAVCPPARADAGFRRCYREHQADHDHRRQHHWRRLHPESHREHVAHQ